jgi:probable HAF family extracellular repeat protein
MRNVSRCTLLVALATGCADEPTAVTNHPSLNVTTPNPATCVTCVAPLWELTVLPAGTWAYATGISDGGVIVGTHQVGSHMRAFKYVNGAVIDLPLGPGDPDNSAAAISLNGDVAGSSNDYPDIAARWAGGGAVTILPRLQYGETARAADVSTSGMVVGFAGISGRPRAFRWTSTYGMQNLTPLLNANNSSYASGVNASNQVVGYEEWPMRALIWDALGNWSYINALGSGLSRAWDINDAGLVVGWKEDPSSSGHYFVWSSQNGLVDLGIEGSYDLRLSVSNRGRIAGTTPVSGNERAFAKLGVGGTKVTLPVGGGWLTFDESRAFGVNTCGNVVGWVKSSSVRMAALWRRYTESNGVRTYVCD